MLCSPLSTGRGCSGEIKGVLWRLRHRSGTSSPWGLWKQKRGITGKREIGGRKKNKQDMLSWLWRRVEVVCKTRNGTWESGSEQNIAAVWLITTENRPQKCHCHRAAVYFKGVERGKKVIYHLSRCTLRFFPLPAGDWPEVQAALNHRDNEWEFNHRSVNLFLYYCHTNQMSRDSDSPGHLHGSGCQESKSHSSGHRQCCGFGLDFC